MTYAPSASFNARCRSRHGQALVEAALVMPVLLFALLAMAELSMLVAASGSWQRGADVLATSAAIHLAEDPDWSGWDALADQEQDRAGCGEPTLTTPDGTDAGGRVEVSWSCSYNSTLVNGLALPSVTIQSVAVIPAR